MAPSTLPTFIPTIMPTPLATFKPSKAPESSSLSVGAIVGIALGGFVFLVLLFSALYYLKVVNSKPKIYSEVRE